MTQNPFPATASYTTSDSKFFRGRANATSELSQMLLSRRIVLLAGLSGSGKTSLLQAGLLPSVEKSFQIPRNPKGRELVVRVRDAVPRDEKLAAFRQETHTNPFVRNVMWSLLPAVCERVKPDEANHPRFQSLCSFFRAVCDKLPRPSKEAPLLLIFDQFEEVLTSPVDVGTDEQHRSDLMKEFFEELGDALADDEPSMFRNDASESPRPIWAVFSMREEYVAPLQSYFNLLPTKLRNLFHLEFLRSDDASKLISDVFSETGFPLEPKETDDFVSQLAAGFEYDRLTQKRRPVVKEFIEPLILSVTCNYHWQQLEAWKVKHEVEPELEAEVVRPSLVASLTTSLTRWFSGKQDDAVGGTSQSEEATKPEANVSQYLTDFVTRSVRDIAYGAGAKLGLANGDPEGAELLIRDWIENKLVTSAETRGLVMIDRSGDETDGMPNALIAQLVKVHRLLRLEDRHESSEWVELAHDRLVDAVTESNQQFRTQLSRRHRLLQYLEHFRKKTPEALRFSRDDFEGIEQRSPEWLRKYEPVKQFKAELEQLWSKVDRKSFDELRAERDSLVENRKALIREKQEAQTRLRRIAASDQKSKVDHQQTKDRLDDVTNRLAAANRQLQVYGQQIQDIDRIRKEQRRTARRLKWARAFVVIVSSLLFWNFGDACFTQATNEMLHASNTKLENTETSLRHSIAAVESCLFGGKDFYSGIERIYGENLRWSATAWLALTVLVAGLPFALRTDGRIVQAVGVIVMALLVGANLASSGQNSLSKTASDLQGQMETVGGFSLPRPSKMAQREVMQVTIKELANAGPQVFAAQADGRITCWSLSEGGEHSYPVAGSGRISQFTIAESASEEDTSYWLASAHLSAQKQLYVKKLNGGNEGRSFVLHRGNGQGASCLQIAPDATGDIVCVGTTEGNLYFAPLSELLPSDPAATDLEQRYEESDAHQNSAITGINVIRLPPKEKKKAVQQNKTTDEEDQPAHKTEISLIATSAENGSVLLWQSLNISDSVPRQLSQPTPSSKRIMTDVEFTTVSRGDGSAILLVGGTSNGAIVVWDLGWVESGQAWQDFLSELFKEDSRLNDGSIVSTSENGPVTDIAIRYGIVAVGYENGAVQMCNLNNVTLTEVDPKSFAINLTDKDTLSHEIDFSNGISDLSLAVYGTKAAVAAGATNKRAGYWTIDEVSDLSAVESKFVEHDHAITAVKVYEHNGKFLVATGDTIGGVRLWAAEDIERTMKQPGTMSTAEEVVNAASTFLKDTYYNGNVRLFD